MTSIEGRPRVFSSPADLFALILALCLFLAFGARTTSAQTASLEVNVEGESAQFLARGRLSEVSVEVYAPSGELVFQSSAVAAGQAVTWDMTDEAGAPVADGVYLATVSMRAESGKLRKRIEQIIVDRKSGPYASGQAGAAEGAREAKEAAFGPTPQAVGPINGEGTTGKIAKFTGANSIGNSVITESTGRIGVNIAPTSVLQVNGAQPPPLATNGTAATTLLQTSGGKGGDTTGTTGQKGGKGASISLLAGSGGNAVAGSTNGSGGNITLQPGTAGTGGAAGVAGNVLLAASAGNVGVGTSAPASKLTVTGGDIQIATAGKGIKFPNGSIQTVAAVSGLPAVQHNATLTGAGTTASPLGVANLGVGTAQLANGAVNGAKMANFAVGNAQLAANAVTAPKIAAGQVVKSINSLEDDVTLAGGANVTITPSGNTLTIASTVPAGSPDYVQNTTLQQAANFNISGNGALGGTLTAGAVNFTGLRTQANATSPNFIGGFSGNTVTVLAEGATIGGGGASGSINIVTDDYGTVGGGLNNRAGDNAEIVPEYRYATVAGGKDNIAKRESSTIGGGQGNTANGDVSTIGGGQNSTAFGYASTIGGGNFNSTSGYASTIGGGNGNHTLGDTSTVGGGSTNTASGSNSTVSGGWINSASGLHSTVPGGKSNTAQGNYSLAAGQRAQALHNGSFVWSDSTTISPNFFDSTAVDQFLIKATNGVGININNPTATLHVAGTGLFTGNLTVNGALTSSGASLTNLDASNITTGTLNNARLDVIPISKGGTGISSVGAAGNVLRSNGSVWQTSALQASDIPSGSLAYIHNQTGTTQGAGFKISGAGTANALNVTGQYNINHVRFLSVVGTNNIFAGVNAGALNVGDANPYFNNSYFGSMAGQYNTGSNNAFFGTAAGKGSQAAPSTGGSNAFFGTDAGLNNTTGGFNSFFGFEAGKANLAGGGNAFVGDGAGLKNTGGGENTFVGSGAGLENLTGNQNAFFGKLAGRNTTSSNNTALGFSAGKNNAGGATNTFVGNNAGLSNTSENNNTFVGASSNGAVGVSNATAVGANATVSQSNTVVLGNNADAAVTTQGKGVILRATDGANCYRVTVNNSGALSTALVTCP